MFGRLGAALPHPRHGEPPHGGVCCWGAFHVQDRPALGRQVQGPDHPFGPHGPCAWQGPEDRALGGRVEARGGDGGAAPLPPGAGRRACRGRPRGLRCRGPGLRGKQDRSRLQVRLQDDAALGNAGDTEPHTRASSDFTALEPHGCLRCGVANALGCCERAGAPLHSMGGREQLEARACLRATVLHGFQHSGVGGLEAVGQTRGRAGPPRGIPGLPVCSIGQAPTQALLRAQWPLGQQHRDRPHRRPPMW
mmetsp:Transcript_85510/g.236972  ORF Transcript_85510/g.236972 Transcript_85510/m.236972 type:complete len:250 (-) Transcript_85510:434-1183(-)